MSKSKVEPIISYLYNDIKIGNEAGYIWSKLTGDKIIIVFDDMFRACVKKADQNNKSSTCLYELKEWACSQEQVRLIAFFNFFKDYKDKEFLYEYIESITQGEYSVKFLIDVYGNSEGSPLEDMGGSVYRDLRIKGVSEENIAFFSLTGGTSVEHPEHSTTFKKLDEAKLYRDQGKLTYELLSFLGCNLHPMEILLKRSAKWFSLAGKWEKGNDPCNYHQFQKECFCDSDQKLSRPGQIYIREVEAALFGLDDGQVNSILPNTWWAVSSAKLLHDSLKSLCCRVPINVGAAYLIALMACYRNRKDYFSALCQNSVQSFEGYDNLTCSVFPLQSEGKTKESAIALYDLFSALFEEQNSNSDNYPLFVEFEGQGAILKFTFSWKANVPQVKNRDSLAERVDTIAGNKSWDSMVGTTTKAVIDLQIHMITSQKGFGSPGTIYMDEEHLYIAALAKE